MAIIRITKPPLRKTTAAKQARFRHLEVAKLQQPRKATQSNRGPARLGFAFGSELLDVVV